MDIFFCYCENSIRQCPLSVYNKQQRNVAHRSWQSKNERKKIEI